MPTISPQLWTETVGVILVPSGRTRANLASRLHVALLTTLQRASAATLEYSVFAVDYAAPLSFCRNPPYNALRTFREWAPC